MEPDDIIWKGIKEDRGNYFVEYSPPRASMPFATLQLVFPNAVEKTDVANAMESELTHWLSRYPVPLLVSSFDATEDLISLEGVRPTNHLTGFFREGDPGVTCEWRRMTEEELPKGQMERDHLERVYAGVPSKTGEEIRKESDRYKRSLWIGWFMVFAWLVAVPVIVAFLGLASALVSVLAFIYSVWKAVIQARKLIGKSKKSAQEQEKEREELRMRHHHYHCERNPNGFRRLMMENFDFEARERVRREATAVKKDQSGAKS
jgi:hypothetical protein